ncbi:hypothetical protein ACK8P5_25705 (plasmid) [Paenibacillus sp. EC2-1]|uniref:hypothetical protein n=1 Tax=Paenibacillus sp. EC2-1 TaxID=3388665 RepID=UPI003BEEB177
MDMRLEMDRILKQHGHPVLLQRTSRKLRCICWNEKHQESDLELYISIIKPGTIPSSCPRCLGTGRVSRIERHTIRRHQSAQALILPQLIQSGSPGLVASDAKVFYMRYDVHPQKGDLIYEVGWDKQRPTHLRQAYVIQSPEDVRLEKGRIEFYHVVAKEANVDTPMKGFAIRRLGSLQNYEPVR